MRFIRGASAPHTSLRLSPHLGVRRIIGSHSAPAELAAAVPDASRILPYPRARRTSIPNVSPLSSALCVPASPRARFLFIAILCPAGRRWHDGERSACSFRGAESDNGSPMRDMTLAAANSPPGDDESSITFLRESIRRDITERSFSGRANALSAASIRANYQRRLSTEAECVKFARPYCFSIMFPAIFIERFPDISTADTSNSSPSPSLSPRLAPDSVPRFSRMLGHRYIEPSYRFIALETLSRLTTSATAPSLDGFVKLAFASTRVIRGCVIRSYKRHRTLNTREERRTREESPIARRITVNDAPSIIQPLLMYLISGSPFSKLSSRTRFLPRKGKRSSRRVSSSPPMRNRCFGSIGTA